MIRPVHFAVPLALTLTFSGSLPIMATAWGTAVLAATTPMSHAGLGSVLASLDLSSDQQDRVRNIMSAAARAKHEGKPESKETIQKKIDVILTPDQRTKFDQQMKSK